MSLSIGQGLCNAIMTKLSDNEINNPASVRIEGGMLLALNSPENKQFGKVIRAANDNGTGHSKSVRVLYKSRQLSTEGYDAPTCDPGEEMPWLEEDFQVTNFHGQRFLISENYVRQLCDAQSELERLAGSKKASKIAEYAQNNPDGPIVVIREILEDFMLIANAFTQGVNKKLLQSIGALTGIWPAALGGTTSKTYIVQNAAAYASGGGSIAAAGLQDFRSDIRQTQFNGTPIIVSDYGPLQKIYMHDAKYFGIGANGINFETARAELGQEARLFVDENVRDVFGTNINDSVVFFPGSLVFTPFLQNVGAFGDSGTMMRFTMPLPGIPGVMVDVKIMPDPCADGGPQWSVWMELYFDVFAAPTTMFKDGDKLEGVNGAFRAQFTQAS